MAMRISDQKVKMNRSGGLSNRTKAELLCFLVIIIVGTVFFLNDGSEEYISWDDTQLTITMPDETAYTIPFGEITRVALVEEADFGVCLSGESVARMQYGIWRNDVLGEYVLFSSGKANTVMQISTSTEDYWIALENSDMTVSFTDAFVQMLLDSGYQFTWGIDQ